MNEGVVPPLPLYLPLLSYIRSPLPECTRLHAVILTRPPLVFVLPNTSSVLSLTLPLLPLFRAVPPPHTGRARRYAFPAGRSV